MKVSIPFFIFFELFSRNLDFSCSERYRSAVNVKWSVAISPVRGALSRSCHQGVLPLVSAECLVAGRRRGDALDF